MNCTATRSTFAFLYQAEEPDELVDRLLEIRDAPAFVPPRTREELHTLLAAADSGSYTAMDATGRALAQMSRLPEAIAHQLGSGFAG